LLGGRQADRHDRVVRIPGPAAGASPAKVSRSYAALRERPERTPTQNGGCVPRRECLDRMLIYNPRHLRAVLSEFVAHYNEHRPHQSRDQRPPDATDTRPVVVDLDGARIRRKEILNGLINEYSQAA
jgi:hypothetical protein